MRFGHGQRYLSRRWRVSVCVVLVLLVRMQQLQVAVAARKDASQSRVSELGAVCRVLESRVLVRMKALQTEKRKIGQRRQW